MSKKITEIAIVAGMIALSVGSACADHPLITDDAGVVGVTHVETELNGVYNHNRDRSDGVVHRAESTGAEAKFTTGVFKDVHIALTVPYTFNSRSSDDSIDSERGSGFGDMNAEIKYRFFEAEGFGFTAKPYVIIPTGRYSVGLSDGRWGFGATLISTKEFDEGRYALHANVVYEHHDYKNPADRSANRSDLWRGSIAGKAEVLKGVKAMLDFGVGTDADKGSNEVASYVLVGAGCEIAENVEVNAGVKFGVTRGENDLSLLWGATIRL